MTRTTEMSILLKLAVVTVMLHVAIALSCWTCKGYVPSDCSKGTKSSMTSVECPEGDSFSAVCIYDAQRGFTFQNRSLVERGCEKQYKDTNICARVQERFNATTCKLCSSNGCNSQVTKEDGSVRNTLLHHRGKLI